MAFIEASLQELPVSANLGRSWLATKISAPGPSSFGWFRHTSGAAAALGSSVPQGERCGGGPEGAPSHRASTAVAGSAPQGSGAADWWQRQRQQGAEAKQAAR